MTPTDLAGPAHPPTGPASAIDVLAGAAALLRQGWGRGAYVHIKEGNRRYCLAGALMAADGAALSQGSYEVSHPNLHRLARQVVIDEVRSRGSSGIASYNDHAAQAVEDVLDVIEAAKARLA